MSLKQRYEKLAGRRNPYVERARTAASLTIPSLFPEDGDNGTTNFKSPYQGVGARAVKSLASKISMAMLPPNTSFFRLTIDDFVLSQQAEKTKGEIEEALSMMEKEVLASIEHKRTRSVLGEASKQLVIAGNVLLYSGKERMRSYRLDQYVVVRDANGDATEVIIKESVDHEALPEALKAQCPKEGNENLEAFTCVKKDVFTGKWRSWQEIKDILVPESEGNFAKGKCPYLALRLIPVSGEPYGRSYVEEHIGDFHSLEALRRAIQEAAIVASRIVFLVRPNGSVKVKQLEQAANGAFLAGNPEEVTTLQLDKQADMAIAEKVSTQIEMGIAQAFLMNSSVQRQAERVTAEEIRTLTNELETQLGGLYSLLAAELQLPMVAVEIGRLQDAKKLPDLPEDLVEPTIVTGVDGLSRAQEFQQLQVFTQAIQMFGPEVLAQNMHVDEWIKRIGASLSVDMEGLIPTREEKEQEAQAQQQQQMMQQLAPEALKAKLSQQAA